MRPDIPGFQPAGAESAMPCGSPRFPHSGQSGNHLNTQPHKPPRGNFSNRGDQRGSFDQRPRSLNSSGSWTPPSAKDSARVEARGDQSANTPRFDPRGALSRPRFEPRGDQSRPRFEPRVDQSRPRFEPRGGQSRPRFEPRGGHSRPRFEPRGDAPQRFENRSEKPRPRGGFEHRGGVRPRFDAPRGDTSRLRGDHPRPRGDGPRSRGGFDNSRGGGRPRFDNRPRFEPRSRLPSRPGFQPRGGDGFRGRVKFHFKIYNFNHV